MVDKHTTVAVAHFWHDPVPIIEHIARFLGERRTGVFGITLHDHDSETMRECVILGYEFSDPTPADPRSQPAQTTRALPSQDAPPESLG